MTVELCALIVLPLRMEEGFEPLPTDIVWSNGVAFAWIAKRSLRVRQPHC